jgi:chromosome segregation ATPase
MTLTDDLQRLDDLIVARAPVADLRNLLASIRERVEALEGEKTQINVRFLALEIKLLQSDAAHRQEMTRMAESHTREMADFNAEYAKLQNELAKLQTPDKPPSMELIDMRPDDPIEPIY